MRNPFRRNKPTQRVTPKIVTLTMIAVDKNGKELAVNHFYVTPPIQFINAESPVLTFTVGGEIVQMYLDYTIV